MDYGRSKRGYGRSTREYGSLLVIRIDGFLSLAAPISLLTRLEHRLQCAPHHRSILKQGEDTVTGISLFLVQAMTALNVLWVGNENSREGIVCERAKTHRSAR